MSAADCPGCGLPVATPADAGSWTPDGTVCWRGGRCEVSAADDADRALDRLLMARGAGETRPVGSASIDRLRQIAAAWHRAVHVDSSMIPVHICDLDAVLADVSAERTRASAAEAARDYWLAQATAAAPCVDAVRAITLRLIPGGTGCAVDPERVVAAVDGLRAECDRIDAAASRAAGECMEAAHGLATELDAARRAATFAETERDTLRALTDSMRADNVRLRAIVESVRSARAVSAAAATRYAAAWDAVGTMPPTPAQSEEIAAALRAAYEAGDALTAALDAAGEGR